MIPVRFPQATGWWDFGLCTGVVSEIEARGARVVPVFAGGLDYSLPVRKYFYDPLGSGRAFVNCVVSLTGFALVGGPARQDAPKARHLPLPAVLLALTPA